MRLPRQNRPAKLCPMRRAAALPFAALPLPAHAHAGEQGFVLLLPTDVYIWSGVAAVALTVVALFLLPDAVTRRLFAMRPLTRSRREGAAKRPAWIKLEILSSLLDDR